MAPAGKFNIIITGPESTGKSTLANGLAKYYGAECVPEYARDYISNLNKPYTYTDLESIAKKQMEQWKNAMAANELYIFDTLFIITKIWFKWVYKIYPKWLDEAIGQTHQSLYLLCAPDLPWEPDPLRENGGEARKQLFQLYNDELLQHNLHFCIVKGLGNERLIFAQQAIDGWIHKTK